MGTMKDKRAFDRWLNIKIESLLDGVNVEGSIVPKDLFSPIVRGGQDYWEDPNTRALMKNVVIKKICIRDAAYLMAVDEREISERLRNENSVRSTRHSHKEKEEEEPMSAIERIRLKNVIEREALYNQLMVVSTRLREKMSVSKKKPKESQSSFSTRRKSLRPRRPTISKEYKFNGSLSKMERIYAPDVDRPVSLKLLVHSDLGYLDGYRFLHKVSSLFDSDYSSLSLIERCKIDDDLGTSLASTLTPRKINKCLVSNRNVLTVVGGDIEGSLGVWIADSSERGRNCSFSIHGGIITGLCESSDRKIFSGSIDGFVRETDICSGQIVQKLVKSEQRILDLDYNARTRSIFCVEEKKLSLLDSRCGTCRIIEDERQVIGVKSSQSWTFASFCYERIRVFDIRSLAKPLIPDIRRSATGYVSFHPSLSEQWLLVQSYDGRLTTANRVYKLGANYEYQETFKTLSNLPLDNQVINSTCTWHPDQGIYGPQDTVNLLTTVYKGDLYNLKSKSTKPNLPNKRYLLQSGGILCSLKVKKNEEKLRFDSISQCVYDFSHNYFGIISHPLYLITYNGHGEGVISLIQKTQ